MIYRIIWTRRALKQLLWIAKPAQIGIKTAVNYRVFFDADDLNLVIAVMEVKKRDSQTY